MNRVRHLNCGISTSASSDNFDRPSQLLSLPTIFHLSPVSVIQRTTRVIQKCTAFFDILTTNDSCALMPSKQFYYKSPRKHCILLFSKSFFFPSLAPQLLHHVVVHLLVPRSVRPAFGFCYSSIHSTF